MSSKPMLHRPPPLVYPPGAGGVFVPGPPAGLDPFAYQVCVDPRFASCSNRRPEVDSQGQGCMTLLEHH